MQEVTKLYEESYKPFFENVLDYKSKDLEPYQHEILESVFNNVRTSVPSCHCMGKTFIGAGAFLAFMCTHYNTTVISTAPTTNLLQNQLWAEIRAHYRKAIIDIGGNMLEGKPSFKFNEKWFGIGFVPRKDLSESQSDFQGFHNNWVFILFDEATGIPKKVWDMAESMMTSANVRFLALGNPTDGTGEFAKVCKSSNWKTIKITCFDSPNVYENGIKNIQDIRNEVSILNNLSDEKRRARIKAYKTPRPYLLTLSFVIDAFIKWGEDSPWFQSRILGEFPKAGIDTLISPAWIQESIDREVGHDDFEILGIDVARFGNDKTVITHMRGCEVLERKEYQKKDTSEVAGYIVIKCRENPNIKKVLVDDTGVGGGVTDKLNENESLLVQVKIIPINFGCKSSDPEKYVNLKAEIFWLLKEDIRYNIKILNCDLTNAQLSSIKFKLTSKGQIQIESKEDMKKRGLPSPDYADSLGICNYGRHEIGNIGTFKDNSKKSKKSWKSKTDW